MAAHANAPSSAGMTPYGSVPMTPGIFYRAPQKPVGDKEWDEMKATQEKQDTREYWCKIVKFATMLVLIIVFLLAELIGGIVGNSLALLSDAFHMTSDSISHTVGLLAVCLSRRKGTAKLGYGWGRAEVLGAVINSVFLLAVVYFIIVEAIQRFIEPEPITEPWMVLIVGILGLLVNVIGLIVFGSDEGLDPTSCVPKCCKVGCRKCCGLAPIPESEEDVKQMELAWKEEDHQECCVLAFGIEKKIKAKEKMLEDKRKKFVGKRKPEEEKKKKVPHLKVKWPRAFELSEARRKAEEERLRKSKNPVDCLKRCLGDRSVNMIGVFIHIFGDFLGSVGVIISLSLILALWGEDADGNCTANCWLIYVDPGLSCLIAILICSTTVPLFVATVKVLMQATPGGIDIEKIKDEIVKNPSLRDQRDEPLLEEDSIHYFRVWNLVGHRHVCAMHIKMKDPRYFTRVSNHIKLTLHCWGIHQSTIQPEFRENKALQTAVAGAKDPSIFDRAAASDVSDDALDQLFDSPIDSVPPPVDFTEPVPAPGFLSNMDEKIKGRLRNRKSSPKGKKEHPLKKKVSFADDSDTKKHVREEDGSDDQVGGVVMNEVAKLVNRLEDASGDNLLNLDTAQCLMAFTKAADRVREVQQKKQRLQKRRATRGTAGKKAGKKKRGGRKKGGKKAGRTGRKAVGRRQREKGGDVEMKDGAAEAVAVTVADVQVEGRTRRAVVPHERPVDSPYPDSRVVVVVDDDDEWVECSDEDDDSADAQTTWDPPSQ